VDHHPAKTSISRCYTTSNTETTKENDINQHRNSNNTSNNHNIPTNTTNRSNTSTKIITGIKSTLLIYHLLDELSHELGYPNGAQDLCAEEPAVNIELLQTVLERLKSQLQLYQENNNYIKTIKNVC